MGPRRFHRVEIHDGQNIIGSAPDADIVVRDTCVSRKHGQPCAYKDQKFSSPI